MKTTITRKKSVSRNYDTCGYEISVEAETKAIAMSECTIIETIEMKRLEAFLNSDLGVMPLRKEVEKVIKVTPKTNQKVEGGTCTECGADTDMAWKKLCGRCYYEAKRLEENQ